MWYFFKAFDTINQMDLTFDEVSVRLWWKHDSGSLDDDVKPFEDDVGAIKMSTYIEETKCDVEIYVEHNRQTYIQCYDEGITPINGQNKWPKIDQSNILPPQYKCGPGKPKKHKHEHDFDNDDEEERIFGDDDEEQ